MADAAMVNLAVDKGGRPRVNCGSFESPEVVLPDFRGEMAGRAGGVFAARERQKMTRFGAFKAVAKAIKNVG
jgi:hypothetical protein